MLRQSVIDVEPTDGIGNETMSGRCNRSRIVQRCCRDVDMIGIALEGKTDLGATGRTKTTPAIV